MEQCQKQYNELEEIIHNSLEKVTLKEKEELEYLEAKLLFELLKTK